MADVADQLTATGQIPPVPDGALAMPPKAVAWHNQNPSATPGMPSTPATPTAPTLSPMQQGMGTGLDQQTIMALVPKMAAARQQEAAANKTSAQDQEKQLGQYRQSIKALYEANKPKDFNPTDPPKQPDNNPLQQFGSLASMIGIFASAFTKKPIMNALNASASAMNAEREGDLEKYKLAYKQWQDQMDIGLKKNKADYEKLNELVELAGTDQNAAMAQLKAHAAAGGSDAAAAIAQMGDVMELGKLAASLQTAQTKMEENKLRMGELMLKQQTGMQKQQIFEHVLKANLDKGMAPAVAESEALRASEGKGTAAGAGAPSWTPQAIEVGAKAVIRGVPLSRVVPGFGKDNPNRDAVMKRAVELKPDLDLAAAESGFSGQQQESRSVSTRAAGAVFATHSLDQAIPLLRDAMKGVDLTRYRDLNQLENAARSRTGDKNLKSLETAIQTVISDYSALIARNGVSTDATRAEAHRLANSALSKGQLEGFMDQVEKEAQAQLRAATLSTGRDHGEDDIEDNGGEGVGGESSDDNDPLGIR